MSIYDQQRVKLRVHSFDAGTGRVVLNEKSGYTYEIPLAKMGPYFSATDPPRLGEFVEGVIVGPDQVSDIFPCERNYFESIGPAPDVKSWTPGIASTLDHLNPDR